MFAFATRFTLAGQVLAFLFTGVNCWAEGPASMKDRLRAGLKEWHAYVPSKPADSTPAQADDLVLHLDPIVVTRPVFRVDDLLAEARRAAAAEKAGKFSPLKGGLLYARNFGGKELNLGIWPKLVPVAEIPSLKKGEVMLRVDLLRLKW